MKSATGDFGEGRGGVGNGSEAKVSRVEGDRRFDIVDHVTDVHCGRRHSTSHSDEIVRRQSLFSTPAEAGFPATEAVTTSIGVARPPGGSREAVARDVPVELLRALADLLQ